MDQLFEAHLICPICYEVLIFPTSLHPCAHTFCEDCVFRWKKSQNEDEHIILSNTCPVCRTPILGQARSATFEKLIEEGIEQYITEEQRTVRSKLVALRKVELNKRQEEEKANQRREEFEASLMANGSNNIHNSFELIFNDDHLLDGIHSMNLTGSSNSLWSLESVDESLRVLDEVVESVSRLFTEAPYSEQEIAHNDTWEISPENEYEISHYNSFTSVDEPLSAVNASAATNEILGPNWSIGTSAFEQEDIGTNESILNRRFENIPSDIEISNFNSQNSSGLELHDQSNQEEYVATSDPQHIPTRDSQAHSVAEEDGPFSSENMTPNSIILPHEEIFPPNRSAGARSVAPYTRWTTGVAPLSHWTTTRLPTNLGAWSDLEEPSDDNE